MAWYFDEEYSLFVFQTVQKQPVMARSLEFMNLRRLANDHLRSLYVTQLPLIWYRSKL